MDFPPVNYRKEACAALSVEPREVRRVVQKMETRPGRAAGEE